MGNCIPRCASVKRLRRPSVRRGFLVEHCTPTPTSAELIRHLAIAPRRKHDDNTYRWIPTLASFDRVREARRTSTGRVLSESFLLNCIIPQRSACCAPRLDHGVQSLDNTVTWKNADRFVLFLLCDINETSVPMRDHRVICCISIKTFYPIYSLLGNVCVISQSSRHCYRGVEERGTTSFHGAPCDIGHHDRTRSQVSIP